MTFAQRQPMSAARLMRLAVFGVLKQKLDGVHVASPGVWPTPKDKLPAVLVRAPNVRKDSIGRSKPPEFNSTVTIEVLGQVKAEPLPGGSLADATQAAQDAIEALVFKIEQLVLNGYWINRVVQQFPSVTCDVEVNLESNTPLAGFRMQIALETFEDFDPTDAFPDATTWPMPEPDVVTTDLTGVNVHLDAVSPFDPSGTYANPPFPSSVAPAPRTQGPDGRDEGGLQINLPQA